MDDDGNVLFILALPSWPSSPRPSPVTAPGAPTRILHECRRGSHPTGQTRTLPHSRTKLLWSQTPDEDDRAEAEQLLAEAYERARRKLDENSASLKAIMKALMDRQELTGNEVRGLVG